MANHLVGMVGNTPAVITEAIWALAYQLDEPVLLDSIELIWTEGTHDDAMKLFGADGALAALKRDYPAQMPWSLPRLAERDRHTVIDIDDVTTAEEARQAATDIYGHVRRAVARRRGPDERVHVVMAGGRKTMSGLMMTAFQLLGQAGDHLWHVALRSKLPEGFFYPAPDDPPAVAESFALHEVPCLLLGRQVAEAGITLDRPFEELLADIQHRLLLSRSAPRLVVDLVQGRATFKEVELRPEKARNSLALLALLAWLRQRGEGWLAAGKGVRWEWQHLFQFHRFKQILESQGRVDSLGLLSALGLEGQLHEVAALTGTGPLDPAHLPGGLNEALEEHAIDCAKWASALDCAARSAAPPVDPFLEGERRQGTGGHGRYRRINLPAAAIQLVLPG